MKKRIFNLIIDFILFSILFLVINAFAESYKFTSSEVSYSNTNSNLSSTNVQSALDELVGLATTGNASSSQILSGYTALVNGTKVTGSMTNNGAVTSSLNAGGTYTIPAGYHNGSGKVTANSLASQTSATSAAAQILSGYTAWVNGSKITGTMTNQGAVTSTINPGGSYTIPAGYHNGSGKITANANQNSGTYIYTNE